MDNQQFQPNFYARYNIHGINIDTYRIFRMYNVTDPCIQHAIKKLLRLGRSHKSREQDLKDAIDTLHRLQVMDAEDRVLYPPMELGATKQMVDEAIRTTYSVLYLPVGNQMNDELDMDWWCGAGWYVIEHDVFGDAIAENSKREFYDDAVCLMKSLQELSIPLDK